jgi:hypothetical protein
MNRAFLVLSFAVLSACSTQQTSPTNEILQSSSAVYASPDGRLYTTIRHSKEPCTVEIIERESGRVLGVAESSARLSIGGYRIHGNVRVTYSSNLSTIVVHEDFSDASPNPRYILFQRRTGRTIYQASYFAPPTAHTDAPGEFNFICPAIDQVTRDTITLTYYEPGRSRVMRISDLLQSHTPQSSQEWPSDEFKRYDKEGEQAAPSNCGSHPS